MVTALGWLPDFIRWLFYFSIFTEMDKEEVQMKKGLNHSNFIHEWAQWDTPEKCEEAYSKSQSLRTDKYGGIHYCYSSWHYGTTIASHVWDDKGKHAVIFFDKSKTLGGGGWGNGNVNWEAWSAASHHLRIDVPRKTSLPINYPELGKAWEERIEELIGKAKRARNNWSISRHLDNIEEIIDNYHKLGDFFKGSKRKMGTKLQQYAKTFVPTLRMKLQDDFEEREKKRGTPEAQKKREQAAACRKKKKRLLFEKAIEAWRSGEIYSLNSLRSLGLGHLWWRNRNNNIGTLLRLHPEKEGTVNTSQNVNLPVVLAKKMYDLVQEYLRGNPPPDLAYRFDRYIKKIGHGNFSFRSLNMDSLQIGCHDFKIEEIHKFGKLMGWETLSDSDKVQQEEEE